MTLWQHQSPDPATRDYLIVLAAEMNKAAEGPEYGAVWKATQLIEMTAGTPFATQYGSKYSEPYVY